MEMKTLTAQDLEGNVVPNPTVTVYLAGTQTLATGLLNADGISLSNPFSGNSKGAIILSAPDGDYDIKVASVSSESIIRRVRFTGLSQVAADANASAALASEKADAAAASAADALAAATALSASLARLSSVGDIKFTAGAVVPEGWIRANGAELLRSAYSDLWAFAQASGNLSVTQAAKSAGGFGPGDGSTTFTIPDLRGEFIRGWDDGRGVDAGRSLGSWQDHTLAAHAHGGVIEPDTDFGFGTGPNIYGAGSVGVSGPTGDSETRPRNVALLALIKY